MKTLGVFAKYPEPGKVKTRLAADWGHKQAAALYECFVRDLINRFAAVGDRRVIGLAPNTSEARTWFQHATDGSKAGSGWQLWPQPEVDLGRRMASFFKEWASEPDDRTILIGSDSPTLPGGFLTMAWELLRTNDCVLSPATDGGYVLIGFRGCFQSFSTVFDDVEWSTTEVLSQTTDRLQSAGASIGLTPPWYDVDSKEGVASLRGHLKALRLASSKRPVDETERFLEAHADSSWNRPHE